MSADNSSGLTREELERRAFGRAETPDARAAATAARNQLAALDEESTSPPSEAVPAEVEPEATSSSEPAPDSDPRRRLPGLLALFALVGLLVGAGIGVAVAHSQSIPAPTTTTTLTANSAAALRSLVAPQTTADKAFPLKSMETTLDLRPASIHRILSVTDGSILWIGRTSTDICLIWTGSNPVDGPTGGTACSTPSAFSNGGLSMSERGVQWTWDGSRFTTSTTE